MSSIALENITKIFDGPPPAVSHLTLDVRDGEFLVLVGPSGCGKTTILRLIAGLETPTSGTIHIANRIVNGVPPQDRDVALVFQEGVLYPHLSVYDNLAFPLRLRRLPRGEVQRRVGAAVELLGLADLVRRKPAALSGGQRQRVALGRAIVREPAAFLFDEPLSSLDPALRLALREEIKTLHQRLHTTTVYVTHDQSEAMALGERVGVLQEGQLQQVGLPAEVYDRPVNRFVAGFFGSPPMNFLAGRIHRDNGASILEFAGAKVSLAPGDAADEETAVLVGIRPHDLSLEPLSPPNGIALTGRISLLEPFGSRTDVHVVLASGENCTISMPPHVRGTTDDEIRAYVDPARLHLFKPDGTVLNGAGEGLRAEGPGL